MRRSHVWVGIAVSAGCLVLAALGIEWGRVGEVMGRAELRYLILASVALLGFLGARSVRWRILLGDRVTLKTAFSVTNIGYLVSNVFPFRLGDPTRAVIIKLGSSIPVSTALSTVAVERTLDMVVVVLLLAVTLPFVGDAGWTQKAGLLGGIFGFGVFVTFMALARWPGVGRRAAQGVLARIPRIDRDRWLGLVEGALDGLAALGSTRNLARTVLWSVVAWGCSVGYYRAVLQSFVERPDWLQAAFLTCAIALAVALPSSPGALGIFQTVARYALQIPFGVAAEQAISVAFGAHALMYILMCLLGILGLVQQDLSISKLHRAVRSAAGMHNAEATGDLLTHECAVEAPGEEC